MDGLAFIAKKVVSIFFYPLGFSLLLLFAGIALWRLKPERRAGFYLVAAGTILLLIMSFPVTGFLLMRPLEVEAGPYADPAELNQKGVRYIVVLGAERVTRDRTPADRFGGTLFRLMEGIRLWKQIPGSKLIVSGGAVPGATSDADAMAVLPVELGVPREAMVLETRAWDTEQEARIFAELVGDEPFALVTTARHIPRAMEHFHRLGLRPQAAPCDYQTRRWPSRRRWFLPNAGALCASQAAIHEYVGRLWLRLKQKVFDRQRAGHVAVKPVFSGRGP